MNFWGMAVKVNQNQALDFPSRHPSASAGESALFSDWALLEDIAKSLLVIFVVTPPSLNSAEEFRLRTCNRGNWRDCPGTCEDTRTGPGLQRDGGDLQQVSNRGDTVVPPAVSLCCITVLALPGGPADGSMRILTEVPEVPSLGSLTQLRGGPCLGSLGCCGAGPSSAKNG